MTTLVFDGGCAFCTSSVHLMRRLGLGAKAVIPWQHADLELLGLTPEQCQDKLQWVGGDGRVRSGHLAVAEVLLAGTLPWRLLGRLLLAPVLSPIAARLYTWVSAHRSSLPGGTPACALPPQQRVPTS